jgi:hypothetical protein
MILILKIFINVLIFGLFLYSKLLPHKDKLTPAHRQRFEFFNRIFTPAFKFLSPRFKPLQVGTGLSVDMTQIILLLLLLILLNLF